MSKEMADLMRQPYAVTMARHSLSTAEMRIMMRIMAELQVQMYQLQATKEDYKTSSELAQLGLGDVTLVLRTKDLLEHSDSRNHKAVRDALESLTKKPVNLKIHDEYGLRKEYFTHLIMEGGYDYRELEVEVKISKNLLPYLLALGKGFTRYSLDVAFNASTPYTMKLYFLTSHWRDKGVFEANITEIREWFLLQQKYKEPCSIKRRVLTPAIKELKERGDVWPEIIGEKRMGRRFVGWKFKVHKRKGLDKLAKAAKEKTIGSAAIQKDASTEGKNKAEELWAKCCDALKEEIVSKDYDTWIATIKPESLERETLLLGTPTAMFAEMLQEKKLLEAIKKHIEGFDVKLIALDVKKKREERELEKKKEEEAFVETLKKTYGLSEKQAIKVATVMELSDEKSKLVKEVLGEVDVSKRDGKIRSSVGGATVAKLQVKLGIKLY